MKLTRDLTSRKAIHAKGFLFLLLGVMAAGAILLETPHLRTVVLLAITVWAFCRFYYYLFYVLENYLGREQRYTGILDALAWIVRRGSSRNRAKVDENVGREDSGK